VLASFGTQYGQGLLAKLFLFGLMLLLAAVNRFWLTPKLESALDSGSSSERPIRALYASIVAEAAIGVLVLAIVAWLGTLPVRNLERNAAATVLVDGPIGPR
jgi:putative copper resistance protein D